MKTNNENEEDEKDIRLLKEMGYTQELYRGFSPFMSFTFCFAAINVLTSISLGFNYTLNTGGSSVAIWSWIIGSFFTVLVACSLAEICSVYPSAGSVYHWAGQLVPTRNAPLASFICGWFNFIGNVSGDVVYSSGFASIISAIIVLNGKPPLSISVQVIISIGTVLTWCVINALRIDQQGWLNTLATFSQIFGILIFVTVLFIMIPQHATVHDVFLSTYNSTGFPFIYVCCISILSTLFSFSGYEAGAHLAEETKHASRAVPRSLVGTCLCGAIGGFIYLLALLFAIPNVDKFLKDNKENDDSMNLIIATYQGVIPNRIATMLTTLLVLNLYFGGISSITVTSRIFFSMARDGAFPYSHYLRWIYEGTKIPMGTLIFICVIHSTLLSFQLISTTAVTAFLSISTFCLQISYLIPILFRSTISRKIFPLGEYNFGQFGVPIAIISSIWLIITSFFMILPNQYPITSHNMNYSIFITSGVLFIAGIYWFVSARHWFIGPKRTDSDTIPLLPGHVTNENIPMQRISSEKNKSTSYE
ncbi:unnamed protein product [Adineta steineri]|uniref:Uncharacterized protein n=1 Tax=Adineta steineri TaxID=433720 RepID=A0A819WP26_9BILA|nr:unnamed protein product [Adineta steineri]